MDKIIPKLLNSWEEFEVEVQKNNIVTDELKKNIHKVGAVTPLIYRGQANAEWDLKSSLERKVNKDITVDSYFNIMLKVWNESKYKRKWPNLEKEIQNLDIESIYLFPTKEANSFQIITFMAHLRHHGFPSPLLDWTSDPLIAAFFAFENIPDNSEKVTIYSFRYQTGHTSDAHIVSKPALIEIGPDIPGIERHKNQKSHYTLCIQQNDKSNFRAARFANPEEDINKPGFYIDKNGNDIDKNRVQNVVQKFVIPVSEKNKVLKKLQALNINNCFLFEETEDNRLYDFWNIILANEEI